MKILVINGSLKGEKSNTYRLTKSFLDGLSFKEDHQIETLEVNKLNIKPCLGCFACWNKTPGKCCINDDMSSVIDKLLWADLTIWSFPLYYFNIPGQLKNLVDRQLPMNLPFMNVETDSGGHPSRYDLSNKKFVIISTCGFYTSKGNYDSVISMFDKFYGKGSYTTIICGQGELFRVKELSKRTDEYLFYVKKAGEEYINGGISEQTKDKLNDNLFPRDVFETMADASWGIDKEGKTEDESLVFTKQMAALYNKNSWPKHDLIIEMNYTDIDKKYLILLKKDGSEVTTDISQQYTTKINTPYSLWRSISIGEIEGDDALMKHLYSVEGDFDLMIHWDDYFSTKNSTKQNINESINAKTSMLQFLLPWIIFWVVASIDTFYGSVISIISCLTIPLIMHKNISLIYDKLSNFFVVIFSILLLNGISTITIIPLSYFMFGLIWCVSCLTKIPLTANYSKNDYNGDSALKNPLFMKTNLILTLAWGVLYLLTPIWTYFIMKTNFGSYIGAINSILPIFMGIFTNRFAKWYPKHIASQK